MTQYGAGDVGFLILGGRSILGSLTTIAGPDVKSLTTKTTPLGSAWSTSKPVGVRTAEMSQEGFFDNDSGQANEALDTLQETQQVLIFGDQPDTIGNSFIGMVGAFGSTYKTQTEQEDLVKASATYTITGQVDQNPRGIILHTLTAETTATFNTEASSYDGSASSANGGVAYFAVPALTLGGYTSVTLTVRDSPDDAVWGDLVSSTAVTTAPTAERKTVAGTVERYLASAGTFNGAGSGQSVTPFIGFVRNP